MKKVRRFAKEQPMNRETREAFLKLRLDMMICRDQGTLLSE